MGPLTFCTFDFRDFILFIPLNHSHEIILMTERSNRQISTGSQTYHPKSQPVPPRRAPACVRRSFCGLVDNQLLLDHDRRHDRCHFLPVHLDTPGAAAATPFLLDAVQSFEGGAAVGRSREGKAGPPGTPLVGE